MLLMKVLVIKSVMLNLFEIRAVPESSKALNLSNVLLTSTIFQITLLDKFQANSIYFETKESYSGAVIVYYV